MELASLGPGPHAAMILADLGADVVRVERPAGRALQLGADGAIDAVLRGRRFIAANLKDPDDRDAVLALATHADIVIEGLRPGVAERLGVGPNDCLNLNPALIYGRVTGWGQEGPLAQSVGHDINYIGLTGALHAMGRASETPTPPLNLVGDFGGGSMLLLVGLLAALWERGQSGQGQVVDAAMVDGTALISQMTLALRGMGVWNDQRGSNLFDGSAPFYDTYRCSDGLFVAVGALEEGFFADLVSGLDLDPAALGDQLDRDGWPAMRTRFTSAFANRTRDEWAEHFAGSNACVTPVLTFPEAAAHPHSVARQSFTEVDGILQASPAPRFSRTPNPAVRRATGGQTQLKEALDLWSGVIVRQDVDSRRSAGLRA